MSTTILLVLFKPFRNEAEITQENESPRDAFMCQSNDLDMNSSTFLNMTQQIQAAINCQSQTTRLLNTT